MKNIALITNIPAPYRVKQFDKVSEISSNNFCFFYFAKTASYRNWNIPGIKHKHIFLNKDSSDKNFKSVYQELKQFKPDVIITCGFTPIMLKAWFFSLRNKIPHISFTDSWIHPVSLLKIRHRIIRKIVWRFTNAFICVGKKGRQLLQAYGAQEEEIFEAPLAIDNDYFKKFLREEKKYDIMFSGRFINIKQPLFFVNLANRLKKIHPNLKVLIIGNGIQKDEIIKQLKKNEIDYCYPGFIQQEQLPKYYASSKIFIFPTLNDTWGLVANEAMAVGVPVITTPYAGVSDDLVLDGKNGYILPLDENLWVEKIKNLLNDDTLYNRFSHNALEKVQDFSIEAAAKGIINAVNYILK